MVTGFEDITNELTPFETKVILPMVVASWSKKDPAHKEIVLMKDMIAKTNDYCQKYNICSSRELKSGVIRVSKKPYKTTGPRMRKVIHHIRTRGLIKDLVATSNGYFRTDDPKEIANFIKSCRERANSFNEVADAMDSFHKEDKADKLNRVQNNRFIPQEEFDLLYKEVDAEYNFYDNVEDFFKQCSKITQLDINSFTLNVKFNNTWNDGLVCQIYLNTQYCMVFDTGGYVLYKTIKEVSNCCGAEMIPPQKEGTYPPSMWRAYTCYICNECEQPCEPKK